MIIAEIGGNERKRTRPGVLVASVSLRISEYVQIDTVCLHLACRTGGCPKVVRIVGEVNPAVGGGFLFRDSGGRVQGSCRGSPD